MMKAGMLGKQDSVLTLCGIFALWVVSLSGFADEGGLEYRVKSAFLFNFTRFVQWPESYFSKTGDIMSLCVIGDPVFYDILQDTVAGKRSQQKMLVVSRVTTRRELKDCHVVYFLGENSNTVDQWLRLLQSESVLTVGDSPQFVEAGGIIGFVIVDGKIRFDINLSQAAAVNIDVSSKLLNLARTVKN